MSFVVSLEKVHTEAGYLAPHVLDAVRACIVGGHAHIETAHAGRYHETAIALKFPHLPINAIVDPLSVRVTLHALLRYYAGTGFCAVQNYPDRITGPINLRDSGAAWPRDAALKSRNCEIGDIIRISGNGTTMEVPISGLGSAPDTVGPPVRTIMLQRNLPAPLREAKELTVELLLPRKATTLAADRFTITHEGVVLPANLTALNSQWFADGIPVPLPVDDADVEIAYRAWLPEYADGVYEAADFDNVMKIAGPCHPDNPLRYGVELAHKNAGKTPVEFIAVANPSDPASWRAAFARIRKPYGIVPLTQDPQILEIALEYVRGRSKVETGRECVLWQCPISSQIAELADTPATITALPAGGFIAEVADAQFTTDGIRAGDMAVVDGVDCVVGAAMNEETLLLNARGELPLGQVKLRVWRKRDLSDRAHAIGVAAANIGDKRVRSVWPEQISDGSHAIPGYYTCAALAGLRSGVALQQDLTAVQIAGLVGPGEIVALFDEPRLAMMAELGVWVVTDVDGVAVTRNAITTADAESVADSNESVVANCDSINKLLRLRISEVLRTVRSTGAIQSVLKSAVEGALQELQFPIIPQLGPQLLDGEVSSVRRHVVLKDSVVLDVVLTLPLAAGCGPTLGKVVVQQKIVA